MNQSPQQGSRAPQYSRTPQKNGWKMALIIVGAIFIGPMGVILPLTVFGSMFAFGYCHTQTLGGAEALGQKRTAVLATNTGAFRVDKESSGEMICNEAYTYWHATTLYTASGISVDSVEAKLLVSLGATISDDEQFRQSDDGTKACRLTTLTSRDGKKQYTYHVRYLYGGAQSDDCGYWKNTTADGDRARESVQDELKFEIDYQYKT